MPNAQCDQCQNKSKCGESGCPEFRVVEESEFRKSARQYLHSNWTNVSRARVDLDVCKANVLIIAWDKIEWDFGMTIRHLRTLWTRRGELDRAIAKKEGAHYTQLGISRLDA